MRQYSDVTGMTDLRWLLSVPTGRICPLAHGIRGDRRCHSRGPASVSSFHSPIPIFLISPIAAYRGGVSESLQEHLRELPTYRGSWRLAALDTPRSDSGADPRDGHAPRLGGSTAEGHSSLVPVPTRPAANRCRLQPGSLGKVKRRVARLPSAGCLTAPRALDLRIGLDRV